MMSNEFYTYKFIIITHVNKVNKTLKSLKTAAIASLFFCA